MRKLIWLGMVFVLLAVPAWCANVCTGDISELTDFGKLAYLRDSICTQVSSFDRTGGNDDGFSGQSSYIRKEGNTQVIFDADGPGCIYRIWSANPDDKKIEFFFDGSDKPGLVFERYQDMFQDKVFPFVKPLSQHFIGGWCSYVPIPFARHCKIVAHGETKYLQITWHKFSSAKGVKTFSTDFSSAYRAKFEAVKKVWDNPGSAPWGDTLPRGWKTQEADVVVKPGESADLAKLTGAGVVRALYITAGSTDRRFYRKCVLQANVDGMRKPNVWTPIGDFFIDGFGWPVGRSAIVGGNNGEWYSYWPMPYAKGMHLIVTNEAAGDVTLRCRAIVEPMKSLPRDMGRFYAWWHREDPTTFGKGFRMLTATGRGHFCGVNHYMQTTRSSHSFLEGDEMLWIDDRDNTFYHGTGTEDYFNGGWYFGGTGCAPFYGCAVFSESGGTIDAYRFQVTDLVPFQKKAHIEMEHGASNDAVADYAVVAFWYADPSSTHTFDKVPLADRLARPRVDQNPQQAEHGFFNGGPEVELIGSKRPRTVFSGGRAVACYSKEPGAWAKCRFNFEATAEYNIRAQVGCGPDHGLVAAFVDDKPIGEPVDCYAPEPDVRVKTFAVRTPEITAGQHTVTFKVVGKSAAATGCSQVVDAVFIERCDLVEAESMKILSATGKAEARVMGPVGPQWSCDGQVLLTGEKGSVWEFEMPVEKAGRYHLDGYFTKGPDFGVIKISLDGKEVERDVDLFEENMKRSEMMRYGRELDLTAGNHTLRIEVTGKGEKSTGYLVGLDAVGLERVLN